MDLLRLVVFSSGNTVLLIGRECGRLKQGAQNRQRNLFKGARVSVNQNLLCNVFVFGKGGLRKSQLAVGLRKSQLVGGREAISRLKHSCSAQRDCRRV